MLVEGRLISFQSSAKSKRLTWKFRDGHYGLWLDDSLAKGVSNTCPTFGNEPLSDEGTKFSILAVELWYIGA